MQPTIYAVGFGPGDVLHMTTQAVSVLETVDVIVGYTAYIQLLQEQFPDKQFRSTPMRQEIDRCKLAVSIALEGKTVALVSSGDSGIYGMTGILLEVIAAEQADVEVIAVPGVTAASAAAAILGAPLMHDFAVISLSDLMTPLSLIQKRITCAAEADFVICLYNPKSKKRTTYLADAADRRWHCPQRWKTRPDRMVHNAFQAERRTSRYVLCGLDWKFTDLSEKRKDDYTKRV